MNQIRVSFLNAALILCFYVVCTTLSFANLLSPGPLTKKHAMLEGTTNCAMCHQVAGEKKIAESSCLQCHSDLKSRISAGRGYHAKLSKNCQTCHKEHIGREGRLIKWDPKSFNHNDAGWKLEGAHEKQNCNQCHKKEGTYLGLDTKCLSCHKDQHGPDMKRTCTDCHSLLGWKQPEPTFDHSKTKWQLTGKHREVQCLKCHTENRWASLSNDCKSCHKDPHNGKFQQTCTSCHSPGGWKNLTGFDHSKTGFVLAGKHSSISCDKCHNPQLKPVLSQRTCVACHTDKHNGQLSTDCKSCHTDSTFKPSLYTIEQHNKTAFVLSGKHLEKQCNQCHKENKFKFSAEEKKCNSCHQDYHKKQLAQTCESCHTTTSFKPSTYTLKQHEKTKFALTGKHAQVECLKCHKENRWVFSEIDRQCSSCHIDQHKGQIQSPCASCHQTTAWKPSYFSIERHSQTTFALTGKHTSVQCSQCHKEEKYRFTTAEKNCTGCHQDKHNGQFGQNCSQCHQTTGWRGLNNVSFAHQMTRFPLDGQHRQVSCNECHKNGVFRGTPTECNYCHQQQEPHRGMLGNQCQDCHQPSRWNNLTFRHDRASFPLANKHNELACTECHKTQLYKDTQSDCYACHSAQYASASQPVHTANAFPQNQCRNCHSSGGPNWRPAQFNHSATYPLNNRHATAQCTQCHIGGVYSGTPRDCYSCHQSDYAQATNPLHSSSVFPASQCSQCHTDGGPDWRPATFANHNNTFPLRNDHATASCNQCHINNVYSGTNRDCFGCHQSNYQGATNPVHNATNYPQNECSTCHSDGGPAWEPASFVHNRVYPLQNRHRSPPRACSDCHTGGQFTNTPNTCYGCHRSDYEEANREHSEHANYPTTCTPCHDPADNDWDGDRFNNHSTFPLNGRHASPAPTQCTQCHIGGVYAGLPSDCFACHQPQYNQATNPLHAETYFPSPQCVSCHTSGGPGWTAPNFTHTTNYPLLNDHSTAPCNACHTNTQYNQTTHDCYVCHQSQYAQATNPTHTQNAFPPNQCSNCHSNGGPNWRPAAFNHAAVFVLNNRHAAAQCTQCHIGGVYAGTPTTCIGCHQTNYSSATSPVHNPQFFPAAQCNTCHSDGGPNWTGVTYTHTPSYNLTGNHQSPTPTACNACHSGGVYTGTTRVCYDCHTTDYQTTTNPTHTPTSFPTAACGSCHQIGGPGWTPSIFNHATTFPLQNNHASPVPTQCTQCHIGGVYAGTPNTCIGCHQTNYSSTTNPVHNPQFFPAAQCNTCHTSGGPNWTGVTYTHTPSYTLTGNHQSPTPTACNACHIGGVYTGTTRVCFDCHTTDYQNTTNPTHTPATFPTAACGSCHQIGGPGWTPSIFNHATTFPLQGRHTTATCTQCHLSNQFAGTPRDCYPCHVRTNPNIYPVNHQASSNVMTTNCVTCHFFTDNSWTQGRLNHTWFPITSGTHRNIACSQCHTSSTTYILFDCITCHGGCANLVEDHSGVSNYSCTNDRCYQCHPTGNSRANMQLPNREFRIER